MSEPRTNGLITRRAAELALGLRLACTGGRDSRLRTVLTAIGVGLGVATLLLAASFPSVREHRDDRLRAQSGALISAEQAPLSSHSLLMADISTTFHGRTVTGRAVRPDGPHAPLPPGLTAYPGPGALAVSPALAALLRSSGGELLRERLPGPITGTIGEAGLVGPGDYAFYLGSPTLTADSPDTERIDHFAGKLPPKPTDPVLVLLTVAGVVILLSPVAVFIAAAARFGGEARDRRLAALRLGGADRGSTARIAAGESLAGALLGLGLGVPFFLLGRALIERITVQGLSVFAVDVQPQPVLAALALAAVPILAVVVTLLTMRRITAEPLGVLRGSARLPRLWSWRLCLPLVGAALLYTQHDQLAVMDGKRPLVVLVAGLLLLLLGATALLPPVIDLTARALGRTGGPPAWQLAVGRLRFSPETAARPVAGIVVAVAGAIALQTLLGALATERTGPPVDSAPADGTRLVASFPAAGDRAARLAEQLRHTPGVAEATGYTSLVARPPTRTEDFLPVTVADCADLRALAGVTDCVDGDVFTARGDGAAPAVSPQLVIDLGGSWSAPWQVPASRATVDQRPDPYGVPDRGGLLVTPGAIPSALVSSQEAIVELRPAPGTPDAEERLRTAVALLDLQGRLGDPAARQTDPGFTSIRRALTAGTVAILALIGAGMLVGLLEQLRDRRRTLAVLAAFGTRPRTMALALLWQSVLPVVLGLALALVAGLGLGGVLVTLAHLPVAFAWGDIALMTGAGAGAVLLISALSLPVLWRRRATAGLRYE
ncbi:ABC transporter permease [Kitasatospora sp. NBC_01287]|uniref:ABC transporter permease n=1 Tax=Kitasatospora sp. NBC_01287 TaxID=2903573 RepID=UPI0022553877|nr:ABC transporter permease [Kitasatospora sp. NBC_01287]MCX4744543.1 ABC transporter permease [Kitasatospora sp. NBC_01287]